MIVASRDHVARLIIATAFAVAIIAFGVVRLGLPSLSGTFSDLTLDKLVVSAATDGEDPYAPVEDLAGRYGVVLGGVGESELGDATRIHPRAPGAILLLLPLQLVPFDLVHSFSLVVNALAAVAFILAVAFATKIRADWILLGAPLLVLSHPAISAFEFGSQSFVVAGLITIAIGLLWRDDSRTGGVALGIAIALKLWPALLLIPLWRAGRRRGALAALATSGGLTVLGALVFRLSPFQVWQAMTGAGSTWVGFTGNGSLAGRFAILGASVPMATVLSVLVLLPVLLLLWNRRIEVELQLWAAVLVGLFASPLSWDHYNIVLIPMALILTRRSRDWSDPARWALAGWAALTLGGRFVRLVIDRPEEIAGVLAFSERALVLIAVFLLLRIGRGETAAGQDLADGSDVRGGRPVVGVLGYRRSADDQQLA